MNSTRIRFVVAALLVAVVALTLASPASAFIRLTRQGPTGIVQAHWYDSELPLVSVVDATNDDQPYATAFGVVVASAKAWENVNTSYFTVNPVEWTSGPYLPPSLNTTDGQNSMFFDRTGANFAPGSGVIAFVRSVIDVTDGHTLDADLVFNDKEMYASVTDPVTPAPAGQYAVDLQSVITHEYGHYFSLDHTSLSNATMIPFILTNSTLQRTLELDDQAGISAVYPESAARGLSPDGVDFYATRGTITGTVLSGYNGSAIFGAHVEAWNLAAPTAENAISAISGELTVRNGQGDFKIHGLPPGTYAVRIVPLDGVNTIAADANVGGIFNGLDINFPPEWWNGANESGNGFNDLANQYAPVAVNAGMDTGGIGFVTNTFPGQVEIAQYGATENTVTDRSNAYRAVRFDPPFDPPYTITKVVFPTYTFNGAPGTMPSVMLVPMAANGTPNLAAPLFTAAPFTCSANGNNTVPINITITEPNRTFFWVMRWGTRPAAPPYPGHPFIRMDYSSLERGYFANSYSTASLTGGWSLGTDRNLPVSMFCQMATPEMAPIQASSNLGTNRRVTKTEFRYTNPVDVRADGFPMPQNSLLQVDLLRRPPFGAWTYQASGGAGSGLISQDSIPSGIWIWSTQAVDKFGHKAVQSSMTITGLNEDANEPNGRLNEATMVAPPVASKPATYAPAGDQDYYGFYAKPGDIIDASAAATGQDGANDLDLVMFLFDNSGEIVAYNDDTNGLNPRVVYAVPPPNANANSKAPRKFTILVTDYRGSLLNPTGAPRLVVPESYVYSVNVTTPVNAAAQFSRGVNADGFGFSLGGPNPANPVSKLVYVIPRAADGTRVTLRVYDVQGRLVRTLVDRNETAGPHAVVWDGTDAGGRHVSSGTYFARMEAGTFRQDARVVFVK